jgi:hypothetical protein
MTASNETLANEDTGSLDTNNQATEKFYTQKEVDDMMARTKNAITKKLSSRYEDLGDIEELRQLKSQHEQQQVELQKKRGQFDDIIRDLAQKKDEEIRKRDEIIKNYTVDVPLVSAAAKHRAVNADQVKQLLKPQVRLNESGEVEVLDTKGTVRYNDHGQPFGVEDLVSEFLSSNPHFVSAGASTTQGKSNVNQSQAKIDLSKLDMKNPDHRKMYKDAQQGKKL